MSGRTFANCTGAGESLASEVQDTVSKIRSPATSHGPGFPRSTRVEGSFHGVYLFFFLLSHLCATARL